MISEVSFNDYINNVIEDTLTDYTVDGKCSNCGSCCTNLLPLSEEEIIRIHNYIRANNIKEYRNFLPTNVPSIDITCPFRNNSKKCCTIYPVRPKICRLSLCNDEARQYSIRDRFYRDKGYSYINMRTEFYINPSFRRE